MCFPFIHSDEKGGLFNVSDFGVFLHVPPNAVGRQTKIMCKLRSKDFLPSPAGVMETLVSHIVELGAQNLSLQQPIVATLLHSGPGRGYGYETVVKAFNQEQLVWEELEGNSSILPIIYPFSHLSHAHPSNKPSNNPSNIHQTTHPFNIIHSPIHPLIRHYPPTQPPSHPFIQNYPAIQPPSHPATHSSKIIHPSSHPATHSSNIFFRYHDYRRLMLSFWTQFVTGQFFP